jgi:hypothetical protein
MSDEEQLRRQRDESLLEAIEDVKAGRRIGPRTPREFTDRAAREALEAERQKAAEQPEEEA